MTNQFTPDLKLKAVNYYNKIEINNRPYLQLHKWQRGNYLKWQILVGILALVFHQTCEES